MDPVQIQIDQIRKDLDALNAEYYSNNFTASQDFPKYSRFNGRLKVPHSASDPTVGDVGDLVEVGGKLKICTVASMTAPTWVIVGTQS
jgi:hypothetical protein